MKCHVLYTHPVTGNSYFFVRFRGDGRPVGCFRYRRFRVAAQIFPSLKAASEVITNLNAMGYKARSVRENKEFYFV